MDIIAIAALALAALIGAALTAWGMWLEHRQQTRILDIVARSLGEGREPPAELLARLVDQSSPDSGTQGRAVRRTASFFLAVAGGCFLASWLSADAAREQTLLLAAGISAITGVGLLLIQNFGHRIGL